MGIITRSNVLAAHRGGVENMERDEASIKLVRRRVKRA